MSRVIEYQYSIIEYGQLQVYQRSTCTKGTDEIDSTSNIHSIDAQSNLNQAFSTSGIMIQFIDKNSIGGVFQLRVMG